MILWLQLHKNWLLMLISLVFGTIAAFSINQHLVRKTHEIESKSQVPYVKRVVAARDLPRSTVLKMDDLAAQDFPSAWITKDAISLEQAELLIGKQLNVDLKSGQLLHWAITADKTSVALSARLPIGKRAITIPVDQINSLSGLLNPGDLIDLYVSFEHQSKRVTSLLITGVEVLATGRDLNLSESGHSISNGYFATVTLATSPGDAVKIVAARQAGTITAVLSQEDNASLVNSNIQSPRGHLAGLLGMEPPASVSIPVLYGDRISLDDLQGLVTQIGNQLPPAPFDISQ